MTALPIPSIPVPETEERGDPAREFLESKGIRAISPPIRATLERDLTGDPFEFYLKNRLGIVPISFKPSALTTGSLYHTYMETRRTIESEIFTTEHGTPSDAIRAEVEHLHDVAVALSDDDGLLPHGQDIENYMKDLEKEASLANAMGRLTDELMPLRSKAYKEMEVLHVEKLCKVRVEGLRNPLAARFDTIVADHQRKECWLEDHKTTSADPKLRAASLPWEFSVRLYRVVGVKSEEALELPYPLVGMRHNIVQKPAIRLRTSKAETWESFIDRYRDWVLSRGEYENLKNQRDLDESHPWLWSWIRWRGELFPPEFLHQIRTLDRACSETPIPELFPRRSCLNAFNNAFSPFLDFYQRPVKDWPQLITGSGKYRIEHRDWDELRDLN